MDARRAIARRGTPKSATPSGPWGTGRRTPLVTTQRRSAPCSPVPAARSDAERLRALLTAQQAVAAEREVEDVLSTRSSMRSPSRLAVGIGLVQTPSGDRVLVVR